MPQISYFFGIMIKMFYKEHNPPHFHAEYGEYKAEIGINDFRVLEGKLPNRVLGFVLEWAAIHRDELIENWQRMEAKQAFKPIDPLE